MLVELLEHHVVLPGRDRLHRRRVGRVTRGALGQHDAPAGEESAHPVGPVLAVDEAVVVGLAELGLVGMEALQELVEGALPGGEVHRRRPRQDAVEIEQAGADGFREAERPGD